MPRPISSAPRKRGSTCDRPSPRYPKGDCMFYPYASAPSVRPIHVHSTLRVVFSVVPNSSTEALGIKLKAALLARGVVLLNKPSDPKASDAHLTFLIAVAHPEEDRLEHAAFSRISWAELIPLIYRVECQGAALRDCVHGKIPSIPMTVSTLLFFTEDHSDVKASLAAFERRWRCPSVAIPEMRIRARSLTPPEFEGDFDMEKHGHLLVAEYVPGFYYNWRDWPMGGSRDGNPTGSGDPEIVAAWETKMISLGRAIRGTGETAPEDDKAGDGHVEEAVEAVDAPLKPKGKMEPLPLSPPGLSTRSRGRPSPSQPSRSAWFLTSMTPTRTTRMRPMPRPLSAVISSK